MIKLSRGIPDSSKHNPDPNYLRELVKQTGLSQRECARRLGVYERLFRMYLADTNIKSSQPCTYPVQFCLEVLADVESRKRRFDKGDI
jgi:transcriptional regulator with XRE-family HTH domain